MDPDYLCVFRASSSFEAKRAADALASHGYGAEISSELAPDSMAVEQPGGGIVGDFDFTVWVPLRHGEAAADLLERLGFQSKADPSHFIGAEKPWVRTFRKVVGLLFALLLLVYLILILRM